MHEKVTFPSLSFWDIITEHLTKILEWHQAQRYTPTPMSHGESNCVFCTMTMVNPSLSTKLPEAGEDRKATAWCSPTWLAKASLGYSETRKWYFVFISFHICSLSHFQSKNNTSKYFINYVIARERMQYPELNLRLRRVRTFIWRVAGHQTSLWGE